MAWECDGNLLCWEPLTLLAAPEQCTSIAAAGCWFRWRVARDR